MSKNSHGIRKNSNHRIKKHKKITNHLIKIKIEIEIEFKFLDRLLLVFKKF